MNTNQVGQSMSRERNEHSMDSKMEGIRKGYIYISALLFQIYKKKKGQWYRYHSYRYRYHSRKKRQWAFGISIALTGTGTAGRVWGKLGFLTPFYTSFHSPTPPLPYKTSPSPFFLSHEQIRDHTFLPAFSPF